MISWMQRHKNWLVVTIWISVIAFVGAGFVGWGSYDFGKKGSVIAKVGSEEIDYTQLQREYSNIYSKYSQVFGNQFDEKMAKSLNLDNQALTNLIKWSLIKNFAKDNGIVVIDSEIAKKLLTILEFQKDGKFDKTTYQAVLKRIGMKPAEFEESLKDEILINKTLAIFMPNVTDLERNTLSSMMFIEDKLSVSILNKSDAKVNIDEKQIKDYWTANQSKYKTDEKIKIDILDVAVLDKSYTNEELEEYYKNNRRDFTDVNDTILDFQKAIDMVKKELAIKDTKKFANKQFYAFKKNEINATKTITDSYSNIDLDMEILTKLQKSTKGETLKPIKSNNGYKIVKLVDKIPSVQKSFEEAKEIAKKELINKLKTENLVKMAQNKLEKFDGKDIGYISKGSTKSVNGLTQSELSTFINKVFEKNSKKDFVVLDDKAVVYKITKQRFNIPQEDNNFDEGIKNTKRQLIEEAFIKSLEKQYEVVSYYKKEE
jgi:peptidyl-prolyl cis-trans isomerase D